MNDAREPFLEHCPQCVSREDLRPIAQNVLPERQEALCLYRCPKCCREWMTSWSTEGEEPELLQVHLTTWGLS